MTRSLPVRAALVFLALRVISGVLIWRASADQVPFGPWTGPDPGYLDMTVMWDGTWYRRVAESGYPAELPTNAAGRVTQNAWAFYPVFPFLARGLMQLSGLPFPVVASTLALVLGTAAAGVMAVLLARKVAPGVALGAVAVWAAFPASPSLQLAYTESAAMLLLCLFLLFVVDERWWWAGATAVVMGLTRPIAAPLAVVLAVALLVRWRTRERRPLTRTEQVAGLGALLVTAGSALIWPAVAAVATGVPDAYTQTMSSWRTVHEIVPLKPWLWMAEWLFRGTIGARTFGPVALAVLVMALVVTALGPWARGLGPEMRTWILAYPAYLALVLDPFTSIFRYALPLFPIAVVLIGGTHGTGPSRRRHGWVVTWVVLGVLGQIVWVRELLVFVPPSDYPP